MTIKSNFPILTVLILACIVMPIRADETVPAGIGVNVSIVDDKLTILNVLPKTPAEEAGLQKGLIIVMVNGVLTSDKTIVECIELIRGAPDTKIRLELIDPETGRGFPKELVRKPLPVQN